MGVFDIFRKKKEEGKDYIELLKLLDIDLFSYNHDDMTNKELSLDNEVAGIIKSSTKMIDSSFFDYLRISDYKNMSRELNLLKDNATEKDIRDITNQLSEVLGEDDSYYTEFTSEDLAIIRGEIEEEEEPYLNTRKWTTYYTNHIKYETTIAYDKESEMVSLSILPIKMMHFETEVYPMTELKNGLQQHL